MNELSVEDRLDGLTGTDAESRLRLGYQAKVVRRIEDLTGDHHSTSEWSLLVSALCSTPDGYGVLIRTCTDLQRRITSPDVASPARPAAWLDRVLRNKIKELGLVIPGRKAIKHG